MIQKSNETVIYLGLLFQVWGHAITDNIRRTWFLNDEIFQREFKNCPVVYVPFADMHRHDITNVKRLFEILGVEWDKLQAITQPTQFEKIILPDSSFFATDNLDRNFTIQYAETIEHLRNFAIKNRTTTPSKKVYYFHGRSQTGEERLAEYFKAKGYEIIRPETLTLDEQLNWLINCESFTSTLGSISHNCIFLREGTETIVIPRSATPTLTYQRALEQIQPLNVNYIDSTVSIFNRIHDSFCFIISEQLKKFFGDKWNGYEEEDFKIFLQYARDNMNNGRAANKSAIKCYGIAFTNFLAQLKHREDLATAYNMPPRWETFQPTLSYQTHIHTKGWVAWQNEEQISGSLEDKLDIQAVKINFPDHKVYYSVYYNVEEGWSEEVSNGKQAGTTGKTKAIYGIRIRLNEAGQKEFDILYRVHKFDGDWTPWAKNGETLYSYGQKLNALQIKLEPKT